MQRAVTAKAACDLLHDSHCHLCRLTLRKAEEEDDAARVAPARDEVADLVICGTHPQIDWDLIAKVITRSPHTRVISGFGVHPWFVPAGLSLTKAEETITAPSDASADVSGGCCNDVSYVPRASLTAPLSDILVQLEHKLVEFPHAIVAEIGLDKLRGPSEEVQRDAFVAQLRIAAAHHRPVSVHCVRQYGLLMQILQDLSAEDTPPAIIVHAFTGTTEVAKSLLNLKNKKRTEPTRTTTAAEPTVVNEADPSSASLAALPKPHAKKTKRGSGSLAGTVRTKERIFFGVSLSNSFTVKNFAKETLPLLLSSQRVLLETDAHYTARLCCGSQGEEAVCTAESRVGVNEQEYARQLRDVMDAVLAAARESTELSKLAQEKGVTQDEIVHESIAVAYANAFRAVLD
jgi:Tat protein secretion system quality control protein TatD with DNase activity